MYINNFKVSKNFTLREFQCKDGSQTVKLDSGMVNKLQALRDLLGKPILITSAYRSPEYNRKIGGATNSQHIKGNAVDIQVAGVSPTRVAELAEQVGFTGIGTYSNFTHVDTRSTKTKWRG